MLPLAGVMLLACVIFALVLFGGWAAFGFAVALMILGISRSAATCRGSPERDSPGGACAAASAQ